MVWFTDEKRLALFPKDYCRRFSASRISDTPRAGYQPAQNLSSGFVDLQNNRVLTYEGRFGFHRVANTKESKLSERA